MLPAATTSGSLSAKRARTVRALNAYSTAAASAPPNAANVCQLSVTVPKRASVTTPKTPTTTPVSFDVDGRGPPSHPSRTVNNGPVEFNSAEYPAGNQYAANANATNGNAAPPMPTSK